jgi:hypothetical protein
MITLAHRYDQNSSLLIYTLMSLLLNSLMGCVGVQDVKLDAFIGSATPGESLPTLQPLTESRLLHFQTVNSARGLSLQDERLNTLCEGGSAQLSSDGDRLLCVPESKSSPLRFIDRFSGATILSLLEWTSSNLAKPMMPKTGTVFASPIVVPDQLDHVAIYDEFAIEVARLKSLVVHGFVGPDHLIVNMPAEIWSFRAEDEQTAVTVEETESEPTLFQIGTSNFLMHDAQPYGVLYDERSVVYFLGVDQASAIKLGEGQLIGIGERKAIVLTRESAFTSRLNVFELGAEIGSPPQYSVVLPDARFGQTFRARMAGQEKVVFETYRTRTCDERVVYAIQTHLVDLAAERVIPINTSQEPHEVAVGGAGKYALVKYLDNCGRSMGQGEVYNLSESKLQQLPENMRGQVKEIAVSTKGGYLAVMSEDSVWLLNGSTLESRVVLSGEQMVGGLRFNP